MAGIDWGVITIINGKLAHEDCGDCWQGANGSFRLKGLYFSKDYILAASLPDKMIYLDEVMKYKKSHHWKLESNNLWTHAIKVADSAPIYVTDVPDRYHIIQGYDVSLDRCYSASTAKTLNKLIKKYTGSDVHIKQISKTGAKL